MLAILFLSIIKNVPSFRIFWTSFDTFDIDSLEFQNKNTVETDNTHTYDDCQISVIYMFIANTYVKSLEYQINAAVKMRTIVSSN